MSDKSNDSVLMRRVRKMLDSWERTNLEEEAKKVAEEVILDNLLEVIAREED